MSKLIFDGAIEAISTRKDGTRKIVVGTQEMSPEQSARLFQLENQHTKVYLTTDNIQEDEAKEVDDLAISLPEKKETKKTSPSQELRKKLYAYWKNVETDYSKFNDFYEDAMQKFIDNVASKIPEH